MVGVGTSRRFPALPDASMLPGVNVHGQVTWVSGYVQVTGLKFFAGSGGRRSHPGYGVKVEWPQAVGATLDTSLGFRGSCRVASGCVGRLKHVVAALTCLGPGDPSRCHLLAGPL